MKTFGTFAILSVLCVSSVFASLNTEFIPYTGPQLFVKTRLATPVERRFAVPVYIGWPDRPYEIFGRIIVWTDANGPLPTQLDAVRSAAAAGKLHGADAVMIFPIPSPEECPRCQNLFDGPHPAFMLAGAIKWK